MQMFSCYNTALSYKGDAASYAQLLTPPLTLLPPPLHSMRWPPEFAHYAEYDGMEGRTEYCLFASIDLRIFHKSRETEISLCESSYRNLVRIVRNSRIQAMPYLIPNINKTKSWYCFTKAAILTSCKMSCFNTEMRPRPSPLNSAMFRDAAVSALIKNVWAPT